MSCVYLDILDFIHNPLRTIKPVRQKGVLSTEKLSTMSRRRSYSDDEDEGRFGMINGY